jgi:hypothetical protein
MQGTRTPRQVLFLAQAHHEVWPPLGKRCAEQRCRPLVNPRVASGLRARRFGEFGYLTSFGALRRYDNRPRFPKKLKE